MENSGQNVTLSVCMMVKNEEHNLKRSLSSLTGVADELIVVDTGSNDSSVAIAESFGAKVYHHLWENDFSKHRNQSIGYASSDWLLIFDADEELVLDSLSSASALKDWLGKLPPDCMSVAITLHDIQQTMQAMQFNSVRFFRKGSVQYKGIVHNTPKIISGKAEAVFCPLVHLKHYGYDLTPEQQDMKRVRTDGLLLKRLEKDPDDVVAMFYFIQSRTVHGDYDKAAEYVERYAEASKRTGVKFNGSIYCTATFIYRKLLDKKNAQKWLLAGLKEYPKDLDLLMNMTEYGVWVQDMNLMAQGAKGFLKAYEEYQQNPIAGGNRFTYANTPEAMAYCLFHLSMGMFQQGCQALDKLNETLGKVPAEFNDGMRSDAAKVLAAIGINKEDWSLQSEKPRKVVNLSSRR
jgi:glycosyltransferase involved in cell wall biosynthesis